MTAENLVLEHLRHIRRQVDRIDSRLVDVERRQVLMERHLAVMEDLRTLDRGDMAEVKTRLDRIDSHLDHVEPQA
jgi:hypothetical protein